MLRFEHPEYLWFLLLIPALGVGFFFLNLWQRKQLRRFVGAVLIPQLAPEASLAMRIIKQTLVSLALACLILAVANPQVGTRLEEVKREGIDLFVALDVSLSMKSEDIRPNRLEKAKRDVSELLRKLSGDRVGMVVFAGDAFVQFPLTADYTAADLFLSAIDVDAVPVPGTMIGSAIEVALKSFSKDVPTQKAIVVVSDGENTEGDVMGAVEDAKKAGVRVYSIGMGTPEGGPIPVLNQNGVRVDYKRDQSGSIVLSKLDETMLQQIAAATGGSYHRATSGGNEIEDIFKELASLEKVEFGTKQITGYETRYQYPLAFAILLLIFEIMLSERRTKLAKWFKKLLPAAVTVLLFAVFSAPATAQTVRSHINEGNHMYDKSKYTDAEVDYKKALEKNPKSKEAQFNLGNSYYKQQRFDEAMREYGNSGVSMKSPEERAAMYYNTGNSFYQSNKYQEAINAYKQSLRLNPNDEDTRYNLQMARAKLAQQQQQKQQNKDQKQDQQKQNQQQDQQQNQQQNQKQSQQQKQEEAKQDQTRQQVQKKNQMPKQEADRILDAMRNNEKEVQKNLRKREAVHVKVEKDW
ncbi:MAG: VWA domain-containing protein [Ignavibacteriales bacterium]|nr:VWA domain-containing protein [Ignavibacteriales bacterium]